MAFSKILEQLIEASIADGMISQKEREVLRKKAAQEGIDPDEMDIIIDGRLAMKNNAAAPVAEEKPKVNRCPMCGEMLPPMSSICPACGSIIDVESEETRKLQKLMDEMELWLIKFKTGQDSALAKAKLEGLARQAKARYGDNPKVKNLILEIEDSIKAYMKELSRKASEKTRQKRKSQMGCLVSFLVLAALIFISEANKNGGEKAWSAVGGLFIMCLPIYYFYFRKKFNK